MHMNHFVHVLVGWMLILALVWGGSMWQHHNSMRVVFGTDFFFSIFGQSEYKVMLKNQIQIRYYLNNDAKYIQSNKKSVTK